MRGILCLVWSVKNCFASLVVDIDLCFVFLSILIISLIVPALIEVIIIILIPLNRQYSTR